ncbi:MAG: hypothetical protein Phog2KO_41850 [Phototrophicaceae bacterium]
MDTRGTIPNQSNWNTFVESFIENDPQVSQLILDTQNINIETFANNGELKRD